MQIEKKVSACVNVCIEFSRGKKPLERRRLQYVCDVPDECAEDIERESAMMRSRASLRGNTGAEWRDLLMDEFGYDKPLMSAVASVVWWDYVQDYTSVVWLLAMAAGRKALKVDDASVVAALRQIHYVKPSYKCMGVRRILKQVQKLKLLNKNERANTVHHGPAYGQQPDAGLCQPHHPQVD